MPRADWNLGVSDPIIRRVPLFCLLVLAFMVDASLGLDEDRISCFLLGSVQPNICPLPNFFTEDPLFTYVSDPQPAGLTLEERRRMDRLYYPRSKEIFSEKYDMVFFYDPRLDHFTTRQFADLEHVCRDVGMPSFWALSHGPENWYTATVFEILPISTIPLVGYYHRPWHVVFFENRDPVFTPFPTLGVDRVIGEAYARMEPRQGAVVWANIRPSISPWLVSWKVDMGAGMSWAIADEFDNVWWGLAPEARGRNPFAIDLVTNLVLYSLDRTLITNIPARREARHRISSFRTEKLLILSMLEWADMFGANTLRLSEATAELDGDAAIARSHYMRQEYELSITVMDEVSLGLMNIGEEAVRLKDEALFWVFLLEWMVVTSTAVLAGAVVWSLMVRRRKYRVVGSTRMRFFH